MAPETTTQFDNKDIYLKSAERVLEEGKWLQGDYWPGYEEHGSWGVQLKAASITQQPACLLGTYAIVLYELTGKGRSRESFSEVMDDLDFRRDDRMDEWNDYPGRTAEEVSERFRQAADRL